MFREIRDLACLRATPAVVDHQKWLRLSRPIVRFWWAKVQGQDGTGPKPDADGFPSVNAALSGGETGSTTF